MGGSNTRIFKIRFWDARFSRFDRAFQNTLIFSEQSLCLHQLFFDSSDFEKPCSKLLKILTASCHIAIWLPAAAARAASAIPGLGFRCLKSSGARCPLDFGLRQASPPVRDRPFAWGPGAEGGQTHILIEVYIQTYRRVPHFCLNKGSLHVPCL